MNVIALSTARKGSKSVHNKNILPVNGTPLFLHPIKKALKSKKISSVYCSTNDSKIIDLSEYYDYDIIKRPDELCTDKSKHEDAIVHAINDIECKTGKKLDIVVLLLGNTLGADAIDIDSAIDMIDGYDSVSNFQVLRRDVVISGEGDLPYRWLGRSIRPYIQNEVYMEVDAKWQLEYINNILM